MLHISTDGSKLLVGMGTGAGIVQSRGTYLEGYTFSYDTIYS